MPLDSLPDETPLPTLELLKRMTDVAISLSRESDKDRLMETILLEAKAISGADGGTLYYRTQEDTLEFAIVRTTSLNIVYGGTAAPPAPMKPIRLHDPKTGEANYTTQAVFAVLRQKTVHIPDVYDADGFDFEGTKRFDKQHGYRTKSVITVPLINHKNETIGCLQLVNAKDPKTGETVDFSPAIQKVIEALASQAAVIFDNKQLILAQRNLLESFIRVLAKAIDAKSAYTGAHCERVPMLTEMLAAAGCASNEGIFKEFDLNEEEKYELHVAGWLHDCGKVSTPVHIMDKATKLETIHDRIGEVRLRFEVLTRDAEIAKLKGELSEADYAAKIEQLKEDLAFIEMANIGGEFMADEKIARVEAIAKENWNLKGEQQSLLDDNEVYNLSIRKGTINAEERDEMENHMVHTMHMLEALPFPKHLARVPEYALGHHERMDGRGYPRGIKAGTMSIPARMMAVADVFEALTAADRPYKPAKKLSEAMKIIGFMKKENHLDPDMVDLFVTSKTYLDYAHKVLDRALIDEVDEDWILGIEPEAMK